MHVKMQSMQINVAWCSTNGVGSLPHMSIGIERSLLYRHCEELENDSNVCIAKDEHLR